jgi:Fic family protein
MKVDEFKSSPSGHLVPIEQGRWAFVPNRLPPELDLAALAVPLSRAASILGELNGIGRTLDEPMLLVRPLQFQEAITSSEMEGTYTTIDDLLLVEAGEERNIQSDAREVRNYRAALSEAIESLQTVPLSLRTLKDAHRTLLSRVTTARGAAIQAGEFKVHQNYIGRSVEQARFVPPPPRQSLEAMSDLEKFLHRDGAEELPPLIEAALVHYQFETIHPFADGNGRVGRILVILHLHVRQAIAQPLLYLSPVLEQRKDEYIDRMFEVSRSGAWTAWIIFFLDVVSVAARRAITVSDDLLRLKQRYRGQLQTAGRSARTLAIVDRLFQNPMISIPQVADALKITYRAAQLNVEHLVAAGILEEVPYRGNPKFFAARELINIIQTTTKPQA